MKQNDWANKMTGGRNNDWANRLTVESIERDIDGNMFSIIERVTAYVP